METGVFQTDENEVFLWIEGILDPCVSDDKNDIVLFLTQVYSCLATDPFNFVDQVLQSLHAVSYSSTDHLTKEKR